MLAIIGVGAAINTALYNSGFGLSDTFTANGPAASTRIAVLTNHADWGVTAVVLITALAAAVFTFRHWYILRRALTRGEAFAVSHLWFDVVLVLILTSGVILTRTIT
jgi:hypothetical protein